MTMTFITQGGEGQGDTSKESKATKSKGRGLEEGADRALMRQGGGWTWWESVISVFESLIKGIDLACEGCRTEGTDGERLRLTLSAEA